MIPLKIKELSNKFLKLLMEMKTIEIVFDGFVPELFQDEMGVILDGYFENRWCFLF